MVSTFKCPVSDVTPAGPLPDKKPHVVVNHFKYFPTRCASYMTSGAARPEALTAEQTDTKLIRV